MKQIVIMPGGFHPFHAGHYALYKSALDAFPGADVYVAATNDQKARPFPFSIKEKLAKVAGVAPGRFVQVKSPFKAEEITSHYNPNEDVLIFVRSEKDRTEQPKPGGTKKDGTPAYFQPWTGKNVQPFSKHAYIAYLPTVVFGPGIKSATEIRNSWPNLNDRQKTAMVMSLYPATQKNNKLAKNVVQMLDIGMGTEPVQEGWEERYQSNLDSAKADLARLRGDWESDAQEMEKINKFTEFAKKKLESSSDELLHNTAKQLSEIEAKHFMDLPRAMTYKVGSIDKLTPIVNELFVVEREKRGLVKPINKPDTPNHVNMPFGSISGPEAYWDREVAIWGGAEGREIARNLIDAGYVENLKEFLYMLALIKTKPELRELPSDIQVGTTDEYAYYAKELRDMGLIGDQQYLNSRFNDEKLEKQLASKKLSEVGDQPYQAGQRWRSNGGGEYTKSTTLPDGRNLEIVVEYEKPYALVNFYIDSAQQKTGKGDAYKIFATVGKEVNDFVGKYKPDILAFTASMAEESRVKLYDRFAERMVKSLPNFSSYTNISHDEELYGDLLDFADARHDIQEQILYVFASPKYMKEIETMMEDKKQGAVANMVFDFYKPIVKDVHKEKLPDYVDQARELMHKADPATKQKLLDIFKKGKENPYLQGGIITTVGALLAGGVLNSAQSMGLSPQQTNLALQAILNTVIPTLVSRINGKNWIDTIKYTLASAGVGTGIAAITEGDNHDYIDET